MVILLTFLRTYRYLPVPGPHDLSRIMSRKTGSFLRYYKYLWELTGTISTLGIRLLKKFDREPGEPFGSFSISRNLTPGQTGSGIFSGSGPLGNSLFSKILEVPVLHYN